MSRVILYRVADKPRLIRVDAAPGDDHAAALRELLGGPVARIPLHDGIELCSNRDGLLYGLSLARRKLAAPPVMPWRPESTLRFDRPEPVLSSDEWLVSTDFLIARFAGGGELADLTEDDIRLWMFWLGLDYILNR
jgi:hypothetical protein